MKRIRLGIYDLGGAGGSSRYLRDLLRAVPQDQFQCVFFPVNPAQPMQAQKPEPTRSTSPAGEGTCPVAKRQLALVWHRFPTSLRLATGLFRETLTLARQIRNARLDVFHSNYTGFETAPIAARLAGVRRTVGVYHNLPSEGYVAAKWLQRFVEHLSGWSLTTPIAVSQATAVEWEARCHSLRGRFRVIYNGVDVAEIANQARPALTRIELGIDQDAPILVVAARLHPMKGLQYLLEAMPTILARFPKTMLLLVGDGPERARLQRQADSLGLSNTVRFMGWQQQAPRYLALADVVIQPSVNLETFGYTVAEAMALAKPVVVTNVGGMPELVIHESTGLVVPKRDAQHLAEAITRFLSEPFFGAAAGRNGRARVGECFSLQQMIAKTLEQYRTDA